MGDRETVAVAGPTVGEALAAAARALEAAGVPEPRREADELYAALVRGATSAAWTERGRPLKGRHAWPGRWRGGRRDTRRRTPRAGRHSGATGSGWTSGR